MKTFFKKVLSILFGIFWIAIIPIGIIASIFTCLFTDATLMWCFKFWVLCTITLLMGKGFDELDDSEGYNEWLYGD